MKSNYIKYDEIEKDFYFHLGLLSTKFAAMEANVISILGGMITDDIFLINPIIERNSLSQNIDLLKRTYQYKEFEILLIEDIITRILKIKKDRNLFVHGLWGKPYQEDEEIFIVCLEQKVTPKMVRHGRMWTSAKEHSFKLSEIVLLIEELDLIIVLQNNLLEKI